MSMRKARFLKQQEEQYEQDMAVKYAFSKKGNINNE